MPLCAGDKLGPYEIIALTGAGGMGEVYRARDPRLNRDVAIKVSAIEFGERFEREAHAIAALNHPNICTLHDVGPNYLVMEFIEGIPLKGPLPAQQALRYALQICDALDAAHKKNITHRDLKPDNILLTESGVKLLDFGLAKVSVANVPDDATQAIHLTEAGAVVGTAAYMSPEQAKGEEVDARSDIFSFGLVLYELLSGRRAFARNSTPETLAAIMRDEPAPLDAPLNLSAVVTRCLRKSRADRFQTMSEVRKALEQVNTTPAEAAPSIAVLPFANMSADKEQEYFSDGLAEEILNLLAHIPGLRVTARTSSFAFRGKEQDVRTIAEALSVGTILEGSVRRAGNRVRITAQLINAKDGYHLWSERYDRELTDVFAIQDEIAQAIGAALRLKLIVNPSRHQPNLPAYEALLKARHAIRTYLPEAQVLTRQYCEQAIALDPKYAAPHALLGFHYLYTATHRSNIPEVAVLIRREALAALELDPFETDPHMLLGAVASVHDYRWPEAAREFELALASSSAPAEAHWAYASLYLAAFARMDESILEMRRAVEKDPLNVNWRGILMAHLVSAGRYEEALEEGFKARHLPQNEIHPSLAMGEAYLALGRVAEAVVSAEKAHLNFPQHALAAGFLAACFVRVGQQDRAAALLQEMGDTPTPVWGRVWYHLLCSEIDEAAIWYEKMIEARDPFAVVYSNSPYTKDFRASPHWPKLARRMNLSA